MAEQRTHPRRFHRLREPGHRLQAPPRRVRHPQDPRTSGGKRQGDRQEGVRRLGRVQAVHQAAPRERHRADRDPPPVHDRQELGRHPAGRRRDGPGVVQGTHRHVRHRVGRLRLLPAGLQAQGERQARHRHRHEGLDVRPAVRQLRRVHLLRGPGEAAGHPRRRARPAAVDIAPEKKEVFDLLLESIGALISENKDPIFASMVKDTMQRKKPSFNESAYGYRSFSNLLIDAEKQGLHQAAPRQEGRLDLRGGGLRRAGVGSRRSDDLGPAGTRAARPRVRPPVRPTLRPFRAQVDEGVLRSHMM